VPILLLLLLLPLVVIALTPLILIQRYRVASARRLARPWLATLNLVLIAISAVLFLGGAALTAVWVRDALSGAAAGVALGMVLGSVGLALTRWEPTPATLHFTPNRWLVLFVTVVVSARVLYGLWRMWTVAKAGVYGTAMVTAFGIPESLGAGGLVIGYYAAYAWGVRRRVSEWQKRPLRVL
jgi:hypothetical protein